MTAPNDRAGQTRFQVLTCTSRSFERGRECRETRLAQNGFSASHPGFSFLGIQSVTLSASNLRVNVSGNIVISCTVIGGPVDLNITWFKAGKTIGLSHRTKVETGVRHSRLTVRDVKAEDEGVYICQAM